MTKHPPLLPETTFAPLPQAKLNAMINTALTHRQLPRQAQVISFSQRLAYASGMTAMAASIMLAFMFTPQYSTPVTSPVASTGTDLAATADDVSDLLLLESFGA
ncbi:MAG: hypothetical protein EON60_04055 [Alphaproteobacteria bacterium]|nr:MAG: hypothetical protein EON60_04055 [Alphaproteobacteria bacterium]